MATGWDNGLSQDYSYPLFKWFASKIDARYQVRRAIMIFSNPHTQQIHPPAGQIVNKIEGIKLKNVFIEHSGSAYAELFRWLGYKVVNAITEADIVCFTGGEDVSPGIYGDLQHPLTGCNPWRDEKESKVFRHCVENNIPMVGICRGGQFLNVMSGGRMYQHVEKHCGPHEIIDARSGETILVSSTHHQMMMPSPGAILVAYSTLMGSREWYDGEVFKKDVSEQDIEVVFYPQFRTLCFQPHPEFNLAQYHRMRHYFGELIKEFLED